MRSVIRWTAVLAVVAFAGLVCAFTLRHALAPASLLLRISETQLSADGFSSTQLVIETNGHRLRDLKIESDDLHRVRVDSVVVNGSRAVATLRAGVMPGPVELRVSAAGARPHEVGLTTVLDTSDAVGDGTPDFLRLHDAADRAAFRRWFTLLAEAQYFRGNRLPREIDDCAALLRFSYREALRDHDSAWAGAMALPLSAAGDEPQQYHYPFTPLGAAIFRVHGGSFEAADLANGAFAEFADAKTLLQYNTYNVGRDIGRARPGDLLFFRQAGHDMPFHAMIFLGTSQIDQGRGRYAVYHTGPQGKWPGEIRRLSIAELMNYPDARWRPVPPNPSFLGVYRWNILRGGE